MGNGHTKPPLGAPGVVEFNIFQGYYAFSRIRRYTLTKKRTKKEETSSEAELNPPIKAVFNSTFETTLQKKGEEDRGNN